MSVTIKTNMDAVRTFNLMDANHTLAHKHLMKVSTGMKVRDAQDDASAYAISERMRVRIRALDQAYSNTQNGSNMMKTAEGAVSNIIDTLKTLKEKAIAAANDSNSDEDRRLMQKEFDQLVDQIDEDALITFNNKYLIDGTRNFVMYPNFPLGLGASSVYFNGNLSTNTTSETALTSLRRRNGDSLEIQSNDIFQVSWVIDGKHFTDSGTVGSKTIGDIMMSPNNDDVYYSVMTGHPNMNGGAVIIGTSEEIEVPLEKASLSFQWKDREGNPFTYAIGANKYGQQLHTPNDEPGLALTSFDKLSGFTINIMDSEGNIKKSANAALEFKLLQRDETITGDNSLSFQVGAVANFATKFALTDMRTLALGLRGTDGSIVSISTKEDANATINVLTNVLEKVLDQQSTIGSAIKRLEHTATNLNTSSTDDQASESVIRDADMATEMAGYLKYNVLTQASQAMLAQANQNPKNIIALLTGQSAGK